ncbi:hypothetical protein EON81_09985 [bacterium]|nr:MAG: hypothetical protein EON81_09985 [bacterium]
MPSDAGKRTHGENPALMSDETLEGRLRVRMRRVNDAERQLDTEKYYLTQIQGEAIKRGLIEVAPPKESDNGR